MDIAATIAGPSPIERASRVQFENRASAAPDVAGVVRTDGARDEAGAATADSPQRDLARSAERFEDERQLLQRLTAEDFAAIQQQLGLRPPPPPPPNVDETDAVSLVDDQVELTIREIPERIVVEQEEIALPDPPPDFSAVVADAVVTIDEYLDWVNEAGGQLR